MGLGIAETPDSTWHGAQHESLVESDRYKCLSPFLKKLSFHGPDLKNPPKFLPSLRFPFFLSS